MLQIAPSGYWRHAAHQRNPQLRCARTQRDDTLVPHIERVWQANMRVYGADVPPFSVALGFGVRGLI